MARILDLEPGRYTFTLTLDVAAAQGSWFVPGSVAPLQFEMQISSTTATFRVQGPWRCGRPTIGHQPVLVAECDGQRTAGWGGRIRTSV